MPKPGDLQIRLLKEVGPDQCLTIDVLADAMQTTRHIVSLVATRLITRGYLERAEIGCFRLTGEGKTALAEGRKITSGPIGPHTGVRKPNRNSTLRKRLWNAMRVLGKFTISDLVSNAARGEEKDAYNNARRYVRGLDRAGYFRNLRGVKGNSLTSNNLKRFALIRNSGPEAPMLRPSKSEVYDPNTGEAHPWIG